jgi:hypothetical protein
MLSAVVEPIDDIALSEGPAAETETAGMIAGLFLSSGPSSPSFLRLFAATLSSGMLSFLNL